MKSTRNSNFMGKYTRFFFLINLHIYSTIKQNEILPFAVKWIYLKKNISSEVSQSKNYMI